jgi:hypothetical protein
MPKASREKVLVQNIGIISKRLAEVAADIQAGNTLDAAKTLKAIGQAAQWLGKAIDPKSARTLPPQILPGNLCQPKLQGFDPRRSPAR